MTDYRVRSAEPGDAAAIRDVTRQAFGRAEEADIIDRLETAGDAISQIVAESEGRIIGHVMFYLVGVRGKLAAAGLGPMSVDPSFQRKGVGGRMAYVGLKHLQDSGVPIVFVLGHPDYYPRLGFSEAAAEAFEAPWKGSHFMANRLRHGPPMSGSLIFPKAFGV
jgi:putative acetyltransferase